MSHGRTIARNAVWLTSAQTAQKAIAFVTFAIVARLVGVEVTGKFFYAVSVTSVFVILTDLGLTPVVIREMAADAEKGTAIFARALRLKLILLAPAIAASLAYGWFTKADSEILLGVALACLVMSADAVSLLWYGVLRGRQRLQYEAFGMFFGQVLTAAVSIVLALLGWRVRGLVLGLLAGSVWNLVWSVFQVRRLSESYKLQATSYKLSPLIRAALPFALAGIFVKIYSYADTLMLKHFYDAVAVGYYAVAYKLTYAFQFLPLTFVAALYPSMSAVHAARDREGLRTIFAGSLRLMMMVSVPITALLSALAPRIITLVYGSAYRGSIAPLTVLPWVLIPIFLDFPVGSLLNATHRAHLKTTAMGAAVVINFVANLILIPRFGPLGAAWAGVVTFWIMFAIGAWFARRDFTSQGWIASLFVRGLMAAAAIWFVAHLAQNRWSFPLAAALSVLTAVIALMVTQLIARKDLDHVREWMRKI